MHIHYLTLLHAIVTHPEFSSRAYKHSEIAEVVSIVAHNDNKMFDDVTEHIANSILQCVNIN